MSIQSLRTRDFIWYECNPSDAKILIEIMFKRKRFYAVSFPFDKPDMVIVIVSAHIFRDEQHLTSLINDYKWEHKIDD